MNETRKKIGAPTKKTRAICDAVCEGIAMGKSARAMCIEVGISQRVLWNWLQTDAEFMQQYAHAKEFGGEVIFEDMLEIADNASNDWMESNDPDNPGYRINGEHVQRSKLRVDARKWYLSKLAPKKYGDRVVNEHQGGDPDKPILQNITVSFIAANPQK